MSSSRNSGAKQCQPSVLISPLCPPDTFSDTKCGARTKPIALAGLLAKHVARLVTTKFKSHVASRPNLVKSAQNTMPAGGPLVFLWHDKNCRVFDLTFRARKNRKTFTLSFYLHVNSDRTLCLQTSTWRANRFPYNG